MPLRNNLKPKQFGKGQQREKIKIIVSFRTYPAQNRKCQKRSKKINKIKKNTIMASFQAKIVWKRPRKSENKNYRFVLFLPDALQIIPKKIAKKLKNTIMASFQAKIVLENAKKE